MSQQLTLQELLQETMAKLRRYELSFQWDLPFGVVARNLGEDLTKTNTFAHALRNAQNIIDDPKNQDLCMVRISRTIGQDRALAEFTRPPRCRHWYVNYYNPGCPWELPDAHQTGTVELIPAPPLGPQRFGG